MTNDERELLLAMGEVLTVILHNTRSILDVAMNRAGLGPELSLRVGLGHEAYRKLLAAAMSAVRREAQ